MENREKVGEREAEKRELRLKKLERGVMVGKKRAGPSTPSPKWRLEFLPSGEENSGAHSCGTSPVREFLRVHPDSSGISARKLCANLWEIEPLPVATMRRGLAKLRHQHKNKNRVVHDDAEPCHGPPDQPVSTGSLRRQIAASLPPQHQPFQGNGHNRQSVSPASHSDSMEIGPYNPTAVDPATSLGFKICDGEPGYSLKTSNQLLKVLKRIWSLEEQHASNISLVKSLKTELDQCREEIKALRRQKVADRQERDGMMRRNKEQDRLRNAIESIRNEIEDERRLRKHSEGLHRKLARELSEARRSFSKALKEAEKERKARILLENLCDEFAKAVKGYEQEVRALKSSKSPVECRDRECADRLILHISEAWLDERLQMRLAEDKNDHIAGDDSVVDKLGIDIETFLEAKRSVRLRNKKTHVHQRSSESYPLNDAGSAPQRDGGDEERCSDSDLGCLDLDSNTRRKKGSSRAKVGTDANPDGSFISNFVKAQARSRSVTKEELSIPDSGVQFCDSVVESGRQPPTDSLGLYNRNQSLSSEGDRIHPEAELRDEVGHGLQPAFTSHTSPVPPPRKPKLTPSDLEKSQSCSGLPRNRKENNTLQARLLEARLESQHARSRNSKAFI